MNDKQIKADIEATRNFYAGITQSSLCDCAYCKSYRIQVSSHYPELTAYLKKLGIDIDKAFETSPLEPSQDGRLEYCGCQYIVLGECSDCYCYQINDVTIRKAISYPSISITQEYFVIEIFPIVLPFIENL